MRIKEANDARIRDENTPGVFTSIGKSVLNVGPATMSAVRIAAEGAEKANKDYFNSMTKSADFGEVQNAAKAQVKNIDRKLSMSTSPAEIYKLQLEKAEVEKVLKEKVEALRAKYRNNS